MPMANIKSAGNRPTIDNLCAGIRTFFTVIEIVHCFAAIFIDLFVWFIDLTVLQFTSNFVSMNFPNVASIVCLILSRQCRAYLKTSEIMWQLKMHLENKEKKTKKEERERTSGRFESEKKGQRLWPT